MKMANFKVGAKVQWKWLGRPILGKVKEIHFDRISRQIKGKLITRKGSRENPAYLVISEAGNEALKLQTELTRTEAKRPRKLVPRMFSQD